MSSTATATSPSAITGSGRSCRSRPRSSAASSGIAGGRGFSRIAKGLNAERIPGPTGRGWAVSGVRELAFRELYRRRLIYGKTRWKDRRGEKVKRNMPEEHWIMVERPALRIVDEPLWQAAHARLGVTRARYARLTSGKLIGRPEATLESRYLLSGFLRCGACGGTVCAQKHTTQKGTGVKAMVPPGGTDGSRLLTSV